MVYVVYIYRYIYNTIHSEVLKKTPNTALFWGILEGSSEMILNSLGDRINKAMKEKNPDTHALDFSGIYISVRT